MIAASTELVDGGPGVRFTAERAGCPVEAFAIRHGGKVHAYVNACAHRLVELDWMPGSFFDAEGTHLVCALHGALYEPDTGRCIAGPCVGAALNRVRVEEHAAHGRVVLIEADDPAKAPRREEQDDHG